MSFSLSQSCQPITHKYDMEIMMALHNVPNGRPISSIPYTSSYYNAVLEAWSAPFEYPCGIGAEDCLNYWTYGQDGEPIFTIKSVKVKKDSIIAKVTHQLGYYGIPWESSKPTIHTVRLVKSEDGYLLDNYDNTKQICIDYIKEMRKKYASGEVERWWRECGADIREYRRQLRDYYRKFGAEYSGASNYDFSSTSNSSKKTKKNKSYPFRDYTDVVGYLTGGKVFKNAEGFKMTFSGSLEMIVNGRTLTGAMEIMSYEETRAVISGYCPYDGGTVRLLIDNVSNTITNIDEPSEVYYRQ